MYTFAATSCRAEVLCLSGLRGGENPIWHVGGEEVVAGACLMGRVHLECYPGLRGQWQTCVRVCG